VKILFDHCVPRPLRRHLPAHDVKTTRQMRWERLRNGKLLAEAATAFDVFLTVDKNIKTQQNLYALPLPVIALDVVNNTPEVVIPFAPHIELAMKNLWPDVLIEIRADGTITPYP
jgi:predicted nuclease of predicted toxin-antitoxin system